MTKICAISDLHGQLDFDIEECDILCICGDFVPLKVQSYHHGTVKWIIKKFLPWCEKQKCEKVYLIAGNHDIILQTHGLSTRELFRGTKVVYLKDQLAEYLTDEGQTIRIYGTPWCHKFGNWAFMMEDGGLAEIYDGIPENVDILMTHDCSYGACDVLLQKTEWTTNEHIGCHPLAEAVLAKKPKYQLSGHLHSGRHEFEQLGDTLCRNVSLLNEEYKMVYSPTYFEI